MNNPLTISTLSKLPIELRHQIWGHAVVDIGPLMFEMIVEEASNLPGHNPHPAKLNYQESLINSDPESNTEDNDDNDTGDNDSSDNSNTPTTII